MCMYNVHVQYSSFQLPKKRPAETSRNTAAKRPGARVLSHGVIRCNFSSTYSCLALGPSRLLSESPRGVLAGPP